MDSEQPDKRWKVQSTGEFSPDRIGDNGEFNIGFISFSPFAESIGTTMDPLTTDNKLWQFGQGLTSDDVSYTHSTSSFSIYNAGDETINPRRIHTPLIIEIVGESTNLAIKNKTTGDEWNYTGTTFGTDSIKLNGVRSTKNGLSIFRDTNKKLITIAPGWNEFEVTGATSFTISFDFRYYYI